MTRQMDEAGMKEVEGLLENKPFVDVVEVDARKHPKILADIPRPDWYTGTA